MLELRELPPALAKIASETLNENKDRREKDVESLRDWLAKQPHLRARTDEQFLINVLRGCKYSIEKAKQKLELYYTTRQALPKYFKNRSINDPRMQELVRLGMTIVLPLTNGDAGPRIMMARPGSYDPDKYTIQEIITAVTIMSDYTILMDDNHLVCGYQIIADGADVKLAHIFQYDPMFMKYMATYYQDSLPGIFNGGYLINIPSSMEKFVNWGMSFLNAKNQSRIVVIGKDMKKLYKHIPQKLLPAEYGGEAGTIDEIQNAHIEKLKKYNDLLQEEEMYGTDESKRSNDLKNADGLFGTIGSFRALTVD